MTLASNVRCSLIAVAILATKQPRSGPLSRAPATGLGELHHALGLSVPYLQQLFKCLRDAGIVVAQCGSKGGYRLTRRASKITLGSVARAVETDGISGVGGKPEELAERLNSCFAAYLDSVTLADVAAPSVPRRDHSGAT